MESTSSSSFSSILNFQVRNEEKARRMLGPDVDMIVGDITMASTLLPEYFKGVKKVINAVSVIVGPKEGDTPDMAKYSHVKSVIPFSEPFTVDPENSPPEKDYDTYFSTLKGDITGKEALEKSPVLV